MGPNGERALLPKSDGASMMISVFQSRDLGFGLEISDALLEQINNCRRGKRYVDEEAAVGVNGTAEKKDL